ncbi:MAG: tail fiber domain-containing protein [Candidatus Korobacteraceae bacterium]
MRRFVFSLAIAVFTFVFVATGLAQQTAITPTTSIPNLIRYGSALKDAQGAPVVSATTGVTFAIYKQQDGGAPVWMETQNVTSDAGGNYNVVLGTTTAAGLPGDLFSQQEQRWLGIQVQGEAEQPRVLLVSVPYALKAHDAETLGGKSVADFVLSNSTSSAANGSNAVPTGTSATGKSQPDKPGTKTAAASAGPTNFSGSTTDQIVGVTQGSTGAGVNATAPNDAIQGTATATNGYGVHAIATGKGGFALLGESRAGTGGGIGIKASSSSTAGTGIRGIETATSGVTTGVSAYVVSPAGTAAVFNNAGHGKIISGQNNGTEKFSVDGSGNVNVAGEYEIGGTGIFGIGYPSDNNLFIGAGAGVNCQQGGCQYNVFVGNLAGNSKTAGDANAFYGYEAGKNNTDGSKDTYIGYQAGFSSTNYMSAQNTFTGYQAGYSDTTAAGNSFYGSQAGYSNTIGTQNTFVGLEAGYTNINGAENSFYGQGAGYSNTVGDGNTYAGYEAGYSNVQGNGGTFMGVNAGTFATGNSDSFFGAGAGSGDPTTGYDTGDTNSFFGAQAGHYNTSGISNTFLGAFAGQGNTAGSNNSYVGYNSGTQNAGGSHNIYIANVGASSENYTIRIGAQGLHTAAYIAGIYGATSSSGVPVYINSNGQLGTQTSSLRFKEQVRDMGDSTSALMKLRPVTFFYKPEYAKGDRTLQYGLIAEEVAQVYPELVAYDNDGQPYTVRYQYLASMLLNEVQKQYRRAEDQADVIKAQQQQIETLKQQLQLQNASLQERLSRLEGLLRTQVETVAQEK